MKKLFLLLTFAFAFISTFSQGWRENEMEVKVQISSKADALQLYELKLNGDIYLKHAILYLTPNELTRIDAAGFDYEITIENLNQHYKNFWEKDDTYHSYQDIIDLADSLATHFPDICTKHIFGTSMGGRQLAALKISDNSAIDENEAEVMFDGGIHGDEIGGPENVIRFARDLCLNYGNDPEITELIDNREIWLYLMVNPDGRVNNVRYNNNGVDLNRDWGYMWNGEGSSTGAFSQVESKGLRACSYDNQFVIHTTYHSGTEYISCPWSYRPDPPLDMSRILYLAGVYSDVSGYANMEYGQGFNGMYAINGSTKDSNYGAMGSISWSMEISYSKAPPASQIMQFYNYNVPSMLAMIKNSGYGIEGVITSAETGDPVAASVFVDNFLPCFTDPIVGDFHKFLLPGNYNITVKANGYQTQTVSNVTVTSMNSTVVDIQLQTEAHQNVHRVISARIPNNNHADEGYTWNAIGQSDSKNYSLGKAGWIVLDVLDVVFDGAGPDIMVIESGGSNEGYEVFAGESMDGPWHSMGEGNGTSEFDLANCDISEARYFKILDDGDGSASGNDAGFDLDAMEVLSSITGPYMIMDEIVIDDSNGNNNGILEPGETVDFIVTLKNAGTEEALAITGTFSTQDQYLTIHTSSPQAFGNIAIGASAQATYSVSADEDAPAGHTAIINFTYEGSNVSQTTKQISTTFPDYCEASTSNQDEYIANVECGDISNSSNWQGGVANYTDMSTELDPGASVPIVVTNGNPWASDKVTAWVDWDKDFDLGSSADETFVLANSGGGETFTGSITAPASALPGIYRLRIRMTYSSDPTPCGNSSYGEVEDYTIIVGGSILNAGFSSDVSEICHGSEVHFIDNSIGDITSWEWEFPGGTPATSNQQNPVITYNSTGWWGVTLTVSDGTNTSTEVMPEYILVHDDPATPEAPSGETEMCQDAPNSTYDVNPGSNTGWYWEISPAAAGTFTQTGPIIEVNWNPDFSGNVQIMVAAINACGQSEMSAPKEITILPLPAQGNQPEGTLDVCQSEGVIYTTTTVAEANSYVWSINPAEAGTLEMNNLECTITFSDTYIGQANINVLGVNDCGEGFLSPDLIVTVHNCLGISNQESKTFVQVLPNPNTGKFSININPPILEDLNLEISSATGERIYQSFLKHESSSESVSIYLPEISPGIYYLKISGNKTLISKKILIQQ